MYVASFCSECFICFLRRMLQVFLFGCCICFTHIASVFIWLLHIFLQWLFNSFSGVFASVSDVCFKYFLPSDICCKCVYLDVAYVSHIYYKCFILMFYMFHTYVVSVCFKCFICFIRMLHSSVLMLHIFHVVWRVSSHHNHGITFVFSFKCCLFPCVR